MIFKQILILILLLVSSCAQLNDDKVNIRISSNPPNSHLFINNSYYGQTPVNVSLLPDSNIKYKAKIVGVNYNKVINLESWASVRGGRGGDTFRCILDAMGFMILIPIASLLSIKCRDFKQIEYFIDAYSHSE